MVKCSMTKTKTIMLIMQAYSDMCTWLYAYRTCTDKQQDGQTHEKGVNAIKRCAGLRQPAHQIIKHTDSVCLRVPVYPGGVVDLLTVIM